MAVKFLVVAALTPAACVPVPPPMIYRNPTMGQIFDCDRHASQRVGPIDTVGAAIVLAPDLKTYRSNASRLWKELAWRECKKSTMDVASNLRPILFPSKRQKHRLIMSRILLTRILKMSMTGAIKRLN